MSRQRVPSPWLMFAYSVLAATSSALLAPHVAAADFFPHSQAAIVAAWYTFVPALLVIAGVVVGALVALGRMARESATRGQSHEGDPGPRP